MSSMAALFSPPIHTHLQTPSSSSSSKPRTHYSLLPRGKCLVLRRGIKAAAENGAGATVAVVEEAEAKKAVQVGGVNGSLLPSEVEAEDVGNVVKFEDSKWINGTWDLTQFLKNGSTDWDSVIDAEAKRRKWLENNPESSSNDNPVIFDTSIIPWWAWVKRYHLPEAELLNGRAAMIGFFMAYLVDSLTGVGLVDQMGNFVCKTLLFISVAGVLLIRKNEDIETLKKLFDETTFYDKQWQATWQDENSDASSKKE